MIRNGEPYIPPHPICPAGRHGKEFTVTPDMFNLVVADDVTDGISPGRLTDIGGVFYPDEGWDTDVYVATGLLEVPLESRMAGIARDLEAQKADRYLGEKFCDRIKNCPGLIDGECGALGRQALIQVLEEVAGETDF